jgi:starvation-inducible DNA-binding protein
MQTGTTKVTEKSPSRGRGHDGGEGERRLYKSPSHLSEAARAKVAESLNARLADGLDLFSQIKFAHWNLKGPNFAALHPLFEKFAESLAEHNDDVAERAVTLGGRAHGTVRQVGKASKLPDYPHDVARDLEHVALVADRIEKYLEGLRETRDVAEENDDIETHDMIVLIVTQFEKYGWFLRATLEGA